MFLLSPRKSGGREGTFVWGTLERNFAVAKLAERGGGKAGVLPSLLFAVFLSLSSFSFLSFSSGVGLCGPREGGRGVKGTVMDWGGGGGEEATTL